MSRPVQTVVVGLLVVLAAVASAGVVLALDGSSAQSPLAEQPTDTSNTITVSTGGEAEAQPDTAVVRVAVESSDADAATARTTVAENVSDVRDALAEMGIGEDQIRTSDYRIYEDRGDRSPSGDEDSDTTYRARHVLTIDLNRTDRVGSVIDTAVDAGATSVHDVRFGLSEETRQELQNEALENAMSDAREQATTLAASADLALDSVASVETGDRSSPRPTYVMEAATADSASTDISTGPVTVSSQVTVTYNASR
ncbi:MAG: SIMPL domain-containing protein [Halanaeroarchaeum sp.]